MKTAKMVSGMKHRIDKNSKNFDTLYFSIVNKNKV